MPDSDEDSDSSQDELSRLVQELEYSGRHQMVVFVDKGLTEAIIRARSKAEDFPRVSRIAFGHPSY